MAYFRSDGWVKSVLGQAIAGAQIYVCTQPADVSYVPPIPQAAIYSDSAGLLPITQPLSTDGFGHYDFYVAYGTYTVVVVTGGNIQQVYQDQTIGFPTSASGVSSVFGRTGDVVAQTGDYSVAQITGAAPLVSPGFTGIPTAPTASLGTNTNQVATCAFVLANSGGGGGSVTSVFGRTGAVTAQSGDYAVADITGAAPSASPTFTGTAQMANAYITGTLQDGTGSVGTSGQVLSSTVTGTSWSSPSGMVLISEQVLGGTAASVTFSGIPGTYRHLRLYVTSRSNSGSTDCFIQFNGDSGSNYSGTFLYNTGNGSGYNTAQAFVFSIASSSAPSNDAGSSVIDFPSYTNTTFNKNALGRSTRLDASITGYCSIAGLTWLSTAAITSILLEQIGGGTFASGSIFTLYGIT